MDNIKTGNLIKTLRKEKGLTQKDLADLLHITDRAVSKWERGLSAPDISLLEPLSNILNVSITEIISGERIVQDVPIKEIEETAKEVINYSKKEIKEKSKSFKKMLIFILINWLIILITINSIIFGEGFSWSCIPANFKSINAAMAIVNYDEDNIKKYIGYSENLYDEIIALKDNGVMIEDYETHFFKTKLDDMFLHLEIDFEVEYEGLTYQFTCPGTYRNGKIELMNMLSGDLWQTAPEWVLQLQDALCTYNPG